MARTQVTGAQILDGTVVLGTDTGGTLPVSQGGTGSATQNFVDLSTVQTIAGAKTFSNTLTVNGAANATGDITVGPVGGTVANRAWVYQGPNGVAGKRGYVYSDFNNIYLGTEATGNIVMDNAATEAKSVAIQEAGTPYSQVRWWYDGTSGTGTGVYFGLSAGTLPFNFRLGDAAGVSKFNIKTNANATVASIDSTGKAVFSALQVTGGTPASGKVLTSDAAGNATWQAATSGGTVTSASVVTANGFAGTVANATTTPAITLTTSVTGILYGNGTSVAAASTGQFPTLNQNTTGTAANVTGVVNIANGGTGSSTQNFVDLTNTQTVGGVKSFTSPVLTTPRINSIYDTNGAQALIITPTASAVNYVGVKNAIAGVGPTISPSGSDTNIPLLLTGKGTYGVRVPDRFLEIPVALTAGTTVTIDASLGNVFTLVPTASFTMAAPTNAIDGQKIMIRIKQDATGGRVVTWTTTAGGFRFGGSITATVATLSTAANKTDYVACYYNATDGFWDVVGFVNGY